MPHGGIEVDGNSQGGAIAVASNCHCLMVAWRSADFGGVLLRPLRLRAKSQLYLSAALLIG